MNPSAVKILDRYRRLCSAREYCTSDVLDKVRKALRAAVVGAAGRSHVVASPSGVSGRSCAAGADVIDEPVESIEQMAQEIVASLIKDKYLDDRRYAEAFARDKASISGWGPVKIRFMLRGKGIPDDIINDALSEVDASRADRRLEKLLQNKYQQLRDDPQCRLKLIRFALGRGYQYADISTLIDATIKGALDD